MKKLITLVALAVLGVQGSMADDIQWQGTSPQTSWRQGANWVGGNAPQANDVAVIPDNTEALATCKDDVDFMNTLSKIKLQGSGSVLCISNLEASVEMTVPMEGGGTFIHRNQKVNASKVAQGSEVSYYPLALNADNSNFTGTFVSTNAGLRVKNSNALGGKNGGTVRVYLKSVQRFGIFGSGTTLYNELYIKANAYYDNYLFAANQCSYYGNIHILARLSTFDRPPDFFSRITAHNRWPSVDLLG